MSAEGPAGAERPRLVKLQGSDELGLLWFNSFVFIMFIISVMLGLLWFMSLESPVTSSELDRHTINQCYFM